MSVSIDGAGLGSLGLVAEQFRQAKVGDLRLSRRGQQDVAGGEIAVDQAGDVRVSHALGDGAHQGRGLDR